MPNVHFTPQLERFLAAPTRDGHGATVREVLDHVFADNPRLAAYVLDDQGKLRQHVAVFVDGTLIKDRRDLSDAVGENSEVFVMQALSGG